MSSAATRIPPELYPCILNHVDSHGMATKEAKQYFSACTLTCHYWATQCRPKLLSSLVLRSTEDIRNLCFFTLNPPGRLPPMLSCVRCITAETRLTQAPPWIHNLHIYLLSQLNSQMRRSSYCYQKYFADGSAYLPTERSVPGEVCLRLFGPLPKILRGGREVVSPHPLSAMLPRRFPAHYRLFTTLIMEDIRFNDVSDFAIVLGDINMSTQQGIVSLVLRNIGVKNPAMIDETSVFFLPTRLAGIRFSVADCTDTASLLWISLMRMCTMIQTPQQPSTLRLSTEENKSILGVACTLISNAVSWEGDLTVTDGRHSDDLEEYHVRQCLARLCVVSRNGLVPLSPSFSFYATPIEDEVEQYQISNVAVDMDPASFIRHGIATRTPGMNLFSWDWPMIAQGLQWLMSSATVRITFPCHSQIPLFCDSQPDRDALKALASKLTLKVQYYRKPHDSATLKQVDNLNDMLNCWYTRFRRNTFVTSFAAVFNDIIHEAATAAIATGDQIQALEHLERARALAWLQHCPPHTPLDKLQTLYPSLADRLYNVCQTLLQNIALNVRLGYNFYAHALEYEALIAQIRELQGFEGFPLRDETLPQISGACLDSPVVLINVHPGVNSYAIALDNASGVHIPLPDISYDHAQQLRKEVGPILRSLPGGLEASRARDSNKASNRNLQRLREILAELWEMIVKPIIDVLRRLPSVSASKMLHVTWCPTGPLTFLPLHAAGIYHSNTPPGQTVMDYAVSSYTPTLRAILRLSSCPVVDFTSAHPPRVLVVSQPATPGLSPLPGTSEEADIILSTVGESAHGLNGKEATVGAVLEGIICHDWVHFACHGGGTASHATIDGAFQLYNGRLSLSTIMSKYLPNAHLQVAVLSFCAEALDLRDSDEDPTEEAVYMAAGMLNVGYKTVIGSMWNIDDRSAPFVMERFYKVMMQQIHSREALQPAYALHEATKALRETYGVERFSQWIPFVHYGL